MFANNDETEEYVKIGSYGIKAKSYLDLNGNPIGRTSPLVGKKVAYNGDSICEGRMSGDMANGGSYAKLIADATGCTFENRGVSGATLASSAGDGQSIPHSICEDIPNMASDADMVVLEGGINDYWRKVPLGDYSETDDFFRGTRATLEAKGLNTNTICGALEWALIQAKKRWNGKKIVFIVVHKIRGTSYDTFGGGNYTFEDVHDKMVGICNKYSVPCIDMFNDGLNTYFDIDLQNYTSQQDGIHPNEHGYRKFYVPKIISVLESLI